MPQLETANLLYDTLMLFSLSFLGFLGVCYSTCTTASNYYNIIGKYIINIHSSLTCWMKF